MYSSLDRIDISARSKTGVIQHIQTDHRSYEEIMEDLELSMAFALIRVLGPKMMAKREGDLTAEVHYLANDKMPFALHQAIASAGGELKQNHADAPFVGQKADVDYIVNNTLSRIAHRLAEEKGLSLDAQGVKAFEKSLKLKKLKQEENEIEYWETVIRLGALAAEAMKRQCGGKWTLAYGSTSSMPLVFGIGDAMVNPFGKAMKLIEFGPENSVAALVSMVGMKFAGQGKLDTSGPDPLPTGPDSVAVGGGPAGTVPFERKPVKKKGFLSRFFGK